jgi:hypothetical protein
MAYSVGPKTDGGGTVVFETFETHTHKKQADWQIMLEVSLSVIIVL